MVCHCTAEAEAPVNCRTAARCVQLVAAYYLAMLAKCIQLAPREACWRAAPCQECALSGRGRASVWHARCNLAVGPSSAKPWGDYAI